MGIFETLRKPTGKRGLDARIAQYREDPTITERTLAALVGGSKTRINVDSNHDDPNVNGMYVPKTDTIILFKCKGGIPAVCVALEEAGHSLEREVYLQYEQRTLDLTKALSTWDPAAPGLLDWYEDGRVYESLKANYPGAVNDLDHVFDLREQHITKLAWNITPATTEDQKRQIATKKDVADEFLRAVQQYKAGNSFKTFPEILDYLEKLLESKPKEYPPAQGGGVLVVGQDEAKKMGIDISKLRVLKPGEMLPIGQMTVLVQLDQTAASNAMAGAEYPWHVLRVDQIEGSREDW